MRKNLFCPLATVLAIGLCLAPASRANEASASPPVANVGQLVHLSAGQVAALYEVDWYSSIDGYLGTGSAIDASALSAGTHTVTFYAFDLGTGELVDYGSTSVTVNVSALTILSVAPFKEDPALLGRIDNSKISLADAIQQASTETAPGFPIQAKLEMNDAGDQVSMSIYTAKSQSELPEKNPVTESSGDPTGAKWTPQAEVFGGADGKTADFEHVARAAAMLNLMQTTDVSLVDVIQAASTYGKVYRVEPLAISGRAVFNVLVKDAQGNAQQLTVDLHKH